MQHLALQCTRAFAACGSEAARTRLLHGHACLVVARCLRTGAKMTEESPEVLSSLKERHFKGESEVKIPGTEGWSQDLASASEAVVKAEQAPEMPIDKMQQVTVDILHRGDKPASKVGPDLSQQPAFKQNLDATRA